MKFLSLFRPSLQGDPAAMADPIDRTLEDRQQRLVAGIHVPPSLERVEGCLLIARGRGQWIQYQAASGCSVPIPRPLREGLRDFREQQRTDFRELHWLLLDLAEVQATTVDRLKQQAGRYVDRILAVAVTDPGLWPQDYDGVKSYRSLCHAGRLAEMTGVSVIDAIPERDLEVGGSGQLLSALPLWLLLADRSRPVARETRWGLIVDQQLQAFRLPPSDGRDAKVPDLRCLELPGREALLEVAARFGEESANGPDAIAAWLPQAAQVDPQLRDRLLGNDLWLNRSSAEIGQELVQGTRQRGGGPELAVAGLIEHARRVLERQGLASDLETGAAALYVVADDSLSRRFGEAIATALGQSPQFLDTALEASFASLTAAILGLLHIDQLPANVPRLTGAASQRVLGRLTPGRPSSWRQLIRSMSQYQPAPMKLRDAV